MSDKNIISKNQRLSEQYFTMYEECKPDQDYNKHNANVILL